jgi:hypothetical protein
LLAGREKEMLGRHVENAHTWHMMKVAEHTDGELRELPGFHHETMPECAFPLFAGVHHETRPFGDRATTGPLANPFAPDVFSQPPPDLCQ